MSTSEKQLLRVLQHLGPTVVLNSGVEVYEFSFRGHTVSMYVRDDEIDHVSYGPEE